MAVNWLSGGKVDHPMADPRQARQIVGELPGDDAPKALEEIAEWLDSINNTDGFKVDLFANSGSRDDISASAPSHLSVDRLMSGLNTFVPSRSSRYWQGLFRRSAGTRSRAP